MTYMTNIWMQGEKLTRTDNTTINGKLAATGQFDGVINKNQVTVHLATVQWARDKIFRFQVATPPGSDAATLDAVKRLTQSLRPITAQEMQTLRPYHLRLVKAGAGDSVATLAAKSALLEYKEQTFRALNGLTDNENVMVGQLYKVIGE